MDSPQSVVSPLKGPAAFIEPEKQNSRIAVESSDFVTRRTSFQEKEILGVSLGDLDGVLDLYIHEARDIHNICIYQNQDVYAKFCLTDDPENAVSTKIINRGGRNPVFNEHMRLSVRKADSSLKCEIWMLSRVRNYLGDQLLGFAMIPVSDILLHGGKLEKEFSLSSTDLFHSPAGFVQLSVAYAGAQPDVIPIPGLIVSVPNEPVANNPLSCDLEKIEFPDPKVVNENHQMAEEYFAMPCVSIISQNSDNLASSDMENHVSSEVDVQNGISLLAATESSVPHPKIDSPATSTTANGTSATSLQVSSQSCETPKASNSPTEGYTLPPEEKANEKGVSSLDHESNELSDHKFVNPIVSINIEPEQKVVQQEIVDMYMKSMQQFTESLAKMKLPMDFENGPTSSENSSSDKKSPASKNPGSRVFYGSRAFF